MSWIKLGNYNGAPKINEERTEVWFPKCGDESTALNILSRGPRVKDFVCLRSETLFNKQLYPYVVTSTYGDKVKVLNLSFQSFDVFAKDRFFTLSPTTGFYGFLKEYFADSNIYSYASNHYGLESVEDIAQYFKEDVKPYIVGPVCSECGQRVHNYRNVSIHGGRTILCNDCLCTKYAYCRRCGDWFPSRERVETRDGDSLCGSCGSYEYVLPYHRYYPKTEFFGNNKNNSVPFLGVELEADFGGESDINAGQLVKIFNKNKIFAYCSHDGSLNDGLEIITQPATMEYHNSIKHVYKEATDLLRKMGYCSHNSDTCGLHIHFNRDFFGDEDTRCLSRLLYIVEHFWPELVTFSRRPEIRMERYAKKISPIPITQYINRCNKTREHDYHYYSVNVANLNTIEFRMFKGTLNVDTILATLQLVNNIVVVSKNKKMAEIKNMKWEDFLTTKYQKMYWERHKIVPDGEE